MRTVPLRGLLLGAVAAGVLTLVGCGRPVTPDIRKEMADAVDALGFRPVYPLSETLRPGVVLLGDASLVPPARIPSHQETAIRVTHDLVPAFEKVRRDKLALIGRAPQSPDKLASLMRPDDKPEQAHYRQRKVDNDDEAPDGSLPLAALPGYTLASVDQFSLGLFLPDALASVFAALGLRNTSYLKIQAEGVEAIELATGDVDEALVQGCRLADANPARYQRAVALAYELLNAQRDRREKTGFSAAPVDPILIIPRRVFYLRGIRFIVEDTRAAAVLAQAAVANPLPAGTTPVALPAVTINNLAPAAGGGNPPAGPADAAVAARITQLQAQLDEFRSKLAKDGNIQISASAARATATGIELVQLFDRPLAFGYQALQRPARIFPRPAGVPDESTGLAPFCDPLRTFR